MKKHIIFLAAFFAAALLVSGCYPEDNPGIKNHGLTLTLSSGELDTKAGDPDPFAFENVIDHFDFYFFKDAEGTQPISGMHGRVSSTTPAATLSTTLDTSENGEYSALRRGTSYVYILANYPGSHPTTANMTLAEILKLPVEAPIVKEKVEAINTSTGKKEETGEVKFCDYLVMDSYQKATSSSPASYTTKLTPADIEEEREVTVMLSRLTAKLAMVINVASEVEGTMTYIEGGETKKEKWTPILSDLRTYYVNALNNKTQVNASPVERDTIAAARLNSYEYLTYPTKYHLTVDGSDDHKFTTDPFYTYPQMWKDKHNGEPYFKIQISWNSNLRGTSPFYYKVVVPDAVSNIRTLNRNTYYLVTVDLSVIDTENDYVEVTGNYIISPWLPSGWTGGNNLSAARFFNVPVRSFEIYSQEDLNVPFYSSSTTKAYFTEISYYHYGGGAGTLYPHTYTEAQNITSITLPTSGVPAAAQDHNQYKLTLDNGSWKLSHSVNGIYTARTIKFVIKNDEGAWAEVTVIQHPAIEVESMSTNNFFVNGHFGRATANIHVPGKPGVVVGVPFTTKRCEPGVVRYHSDDNRWTNTTYESHASNSDNNTSYWFQGTDNYASTGSWQDAPSVECNITEGRYGWVVGDGYKRDGGVAPYLIKLTVSAFNSSNNTYSYKQGSTTHSGIHFVLGDPRVKGSLSLAPYLYKPSTVRESDDTEHFPVGTTAAQYKDWTSPGDIMVSSSERSDGPVIAPRILLSSYYNGQPAALSYANAKKRAATYQEAGYPAGRWRLPTEAEIMFLVYCQQQGIISPVWADGSTYWCADGRYVKINNGGDTVEFFNASSSTTVVNRFVYDLWYWGDDPMEDQEQYWPNAHLLAPGVTH